MNPNTSNLKAYKELGNKSSSDLFFKVLISVKFNELLDIVILQRLIV